MAGPRPEDAYNPVPSVNPSTGMPGDYLSVRASPENFGSQIGAAAEKLGQTGLQSEELINNEELKTVQMKQETDAANKTNQYADWLSKSTVDFQGNNRGMNAVNNWPSFQQGMEKQLNDQIGQIQSPFEKLQFQRDARSFYDRNVESMGHWVGDQMREGAKQADEGKLQNIISQVVAAPVSDKSLADGILQIGDTARTAADHAGIIDPNAATSYVQQWETNLIEGYIQKAMNPGGSVENQLNGLARAQSIFDQVKDMELPGHSGVPLLADKGATLEKLQRSISYANFTIRGRANKETVAGFVNNSLNDINDQYQTSSLSPDGVTPYIANKSDGINTTQSYVDTFKKNFGNIPVAGLNRDQVVDKLDNALIGTEHSGENSTSPKGAKGRDQIEPGTFASERELMGHPDWSIDNPDQRHEVAKHLVGRLWDEYKDPSKVAVAYFSGEGNVSKGSASTSSVPYGQQIKQPYGDWLNDNKDRLINDQLNQFKSDNPELANDPVVLNDVKGKLYTQITRQVTMINVQNKADSDDIYRFINGDNQWKHPIDDPMMLRSNPQISEAWDRVSQNDPSKAHSIEQNLIAANAHGQAVGAGTNYWNYLQQAANGEIKDTISLGAHVGYNKDAPLTNTGMSSLDPVIKRSESPEGRQFNHEEMEFLKKARSLVTGSAIAPGIQTTKLDDNFSRYVMSVGPKIEAGLKDGKSASQLFNPDSKDFIGWPAATPFTTITNEIQAHALIQSQNKPAPNHYGSLSDLQQARRTNQINDDQFRTIAKQNPSWFGGPAPSVPLASFK